MASKIIKIKISKASTMQIQTFVLELGIVAEPDNNRYRVAVIFRIINQIEEQTLELFLQRER